MLKSKKKLFKLLEEIRPTYFHGIVSEGLGHSKISDETYGKESYIYIRCADSHSAFLIKRKLREDGFKVKNYYDNRDIEVHVSFFKGHHWDE